MKKLGNALRQGQIAAFCVVVALSVIGGPAAAESDSRQASAWHLVRTPSIGRTQAIGGYAHGCLAGGLSLPLDGTGYQVMRPGRNRFYGHPALLDYLQGLGKRAHAAGLALINIGDLAQPRGGPMKFGHASHQSGLDVDIWLRLDLPALARDRRDSLKETSVMNRESLQLTRPAWSPAQTTMLRLAAKDPRVARIFVNPVIKLELCRQAGADRDWLHVVRPWYGHHDHFHVRLSCPADSPQCEPQRPLPPGDGCDAELASWLSEARPPDPNKPVKHHPPPNPTLPSACYTLNVASGPQILGIP